MKLIPGPFKDYYDHVAHIHGGGDPKNTYHRRRIGKPFDQSTLPPGLRMGIAPHFVDNVKVEVAGWVPLVTHACYPSDYGSRERLHKWLVVAGKCYPLYSLGGYPEKLEILDTGKHPVVYREVHGAISGPTTEIGVQLPQLVQLSRLVGHPVFVISHDYLDANTGVGQVYIDGVCPVLRDLGLPAIYPAEQLYQDLAYFLGNTMKDSPDLAPRQIMTDVDKAVSHGFDKKISFRHRKEA